MGTIQKCCVLSWMNPRPDTLKLNAHLALILQTIQDELDMQDTEEARVNSWDVIWWTSPFGCANFSRQANNYISFVRTQDAVKKTYRGDGWQGWVARLGDDHDDHDDGEGLTSEFFFPPKLVAVPRQKNPICRTIYS